VALLGAAVWWVYDLRTRAGGASGTQGDAEAGAPDPGTGSEGEDEPVAMGFGDVKLAALLGVVLAWEGLLVALFVAVLSGAIIGVAQRALGGTRQIPFGPFLALGAAVSLFVGDALERLPKGMSFGHTSSIIERGLGSPTRKKQLLREAGALVAESFAELPALVARALGKTSS
jgi:hypothetical protein